MNDCSTIYSTSTCRFFSVVLIIFLVESSRAVIDCLDYLALNVKKDAAIVNVATSLLHLIIISRSLLSDYYWRIILRRLLVILIERSMRMPPVLLSSTGAAHTLVLYNVFWPYNGKIIDYSRGHKKTCWYTYPIRVVVIWFAFGFPESWWGACHLLQPLSAKRQLETMRVLKRSYRTVETISRYSRFTWVENNL